MQKDERLVARTDELFFNHTFERKKKHPSDKPEHSYHAVKWEQRAWQAHGGPFS